MKPMIALIFFEGITLSSWQIDKQQNEVDLISPLCGESTILFTNQILS